MLTIADFLSDNAVAGGVSVTILVLIYKIYQILKHDKREDNISQLERSIRDELRCEIKELKEAVKILKKSNEKNLHEIVRLKTVIDNNSKANFKNNIETRHV